MIRTLPPAVTHTPTPTQRIADRRLLAVANAVLAMLTRLRSSVSMRAARDAVRDRHGVENLPDWAVVGGLAKAAVQPIEPILLDLILEGARLENDYAALFTLVNPRAVQAAQRQVANLVQGITTEGIAALRQIISASVAGGYTPAKSAQLIRDVVGLDHRRVDAVVNYRRSLEAVMAGDAGESAAVRTLADARFSTSGLTPAKIDRMVTRYSEKQLASRATLIARTETIRSASLGQRAIWDEAAARGLIDRDRTRIVWITTEDDRTCAECMEADGQTISLDGGSFTGGAFISQEPPLHPGCRCTTALDV